MDPHRVVIVGGGFGGLEAALRLRRAPVDVTLLDRRNFHLFQPLLYQVATGTLSPADIASPLRHVVGRHRRTRVLLAEVLGIDAKERRVGLRDGTTLGYDSLIVATGASHNYFGHDEWHDLAPGLKTIEDATKIRRRVLFAFEAAERAALTGADEQTLQALMTFVVVGAGPTGVELAGALAEIARHTLKGEYRCVDPLRARILLVEGMDRVLGSFAPELSERAKAALARLGVEVRTGWTVTAVEQGQVTLTRDKTEHETVRAFTLIWAAGVRASRLGQRLCEATGCELDRAGRPRVGTDCSLPGHPEIFVIGDLAHFPHQDGKQLPGMAQVAMQQGRYVARVIRARCAGKPVPGPFRYHDHGSMATIGRGYAVMQIGRLRAAGFFAWLAWLFVHVMYIIEFENRVLIMLQWAIHFFTWNRSARLITAETDPTPPP